MGIEKIEGVFAAEGYVGIPFSFNGVGHPVIKAALGGDVSVNLLLDTGASINLLDHAFAESLGLALTPTEEEGAGAGGDVSDIYSIEPLSLNIDGQDIAIDSFYSMDLSTVREAFTNRGVTDEIHGILGFGFFQSTNCFIDYSGSRIFVRI